VPFEDADKTSFWMRKISKLIMTTNANEEVKVAVATAVTVEVVTIEIMATVP
jgi:hypothetical protein